jgi:hypothetical protein
LSYWIIAREETPSFPSLPSVQCSYRNAPVGRAGSKPLSSIARRAAEDHPAKFCFQLSVFSVSAFDFAPPLLEPSQTRSAIRAAPHFFNPKNETCVFETLVNY